MSNRGFTIVELVVIIAITTILTAVILFSVSLYINKGRDANILGNLVVLMPAGEDFYNNNNNSYIGFCDSSVVINAYGQMAKHENSNNCSTNLQHPGLCCNEQQDQWASCIQEFANPALAYCVDSSGVKKEICNSSCTTTMTLCTTDQLSNCQ